MEECKKYRRINGRKSEIHKDWERPIIIAPKVFLNLKGNEEIILFIGLDQ